MKCPHCNSIDTLPIYPKHKGHTTRYTCHNCGYKWWE